MRRAISCMLILTWLLAGCGGSSKAFVWQHIDTQVDVRADGKLSVTETLTLRYTGGPFTFAYRDLPNRRLDAIGNISVADDAHLYQQVADEKSAQPYTFSVSNVDGAQRVRWVYPETSDGELTFMLHYEVLGAIRRYDAADELWWSMVFGDREELVEQATGSIVLPQLIPMDQFEAITPDIAGGVERIPGAAFVQASNIAPGSELTLRMRFPKGLVAGDAPQWQAAEAAQEQYDATVRPTVNIVLSLASVGVAVLLAFLIWSWWRRSRDPQPQGFAGGELVLPPDDMQPALVAKLIGRQDGLVLLGSLFDLANRGYLVFRETMGGWRGHTQQLAVARGERSGSELEPYEAAMLDALFAERDEIVLDNSRRAITQLLPKIGRSARQALIDRGLLDQAGLARRRQGFIIATVLIIIGGGLAIPAFILAEGYSWWLPVLACTIAALGLVWLIVASLVRGLTQAGADTLARWRGFQRYLKRISPDVVEGGAFSRLLPYAVAIGDPRALTRSYAMTAEPLPVWYHPIRVGHSGGHGGSLGGSLMLKDFSQNFLAALTSANSGVTTSGGGGASGGASGGGGGGAG